MLSSPCDATSLLFRQPQTLSTSRISIPLRLRQTHCRRPQSTDGASERVSSLLRERRRLTVQCSSVNAAGQTALSDPPQAEPLSDRNNGMDGSSGSEPTMKYEWTLPPIKGTKRVVLVRHGESTWNATGRIQGSSDFSVLTAKGVSQADTNRQMLAGDSFDVCFHSPLQRASKTAEIIWDTRPFPMVPLHDLREIDLYAFQGLFKEEGKAQFGDAYRMWQQQAAEFEIDGHLPVQELWERARSAWGEILGGEASTGSSSILVVAHNAVNQALVATATGLGPEYFRRLLQSNCGVSVLDFVPSSSSSSSLSPSATTTSTSSPPPSLASAPPPSVVVTLNRLNQTPSPPVASAAPAGRKARLRVILVCHGHTDASLQKRLPSSPSERLNMLGVVQSRKAAELLLDVRVDTIFSSPLARSRATADAICEFQEAADCLGADCIPRFVDVVQLDELADVDVGSWQGQPLADVAPGLPWEGYLLNNPLSADVEASDSLQQRVDSVWGAIRKHLTEAEASLAAAAESEAAAAAAGAAQGGLNSSDGSASSQGNGVVTASDDVKSGTVIVVGHKVVLSAMIVRSLGLPAQSLGSFLLDPGSVSVVDLPDGAKGTAVLRCANYTAHLGRWAVPVTKPSANDEDY